MSLKVTFDDKEISKWFLKVKGLPKLQASAVNEATKKVRTDTALKIRENTSIKAKGVSPRFGSKGGGLVVIKKASSSSLYSVIEGSKFTTPLSKVFFRVSARKATKRKPARARVILKKKSVVFRNSAMSSSGSIRARGSYSGNFKFNDIDPQNAPLTALRTFSIRSQLSQSYITKDLQRVSFKEYELAFIRAARRKGFLN